MILSILGFFFFSLTARTETIQTYQGSDQGRPCFLYVHREITEGLEYRVEVSTSYEHNGQGVGQVSLTFKSDSAGKVLEWQEPQTKQFLRVLLRKPSAVLEEPLAFRVKWVHFDHLHESTCSDLKQGDK